MMTNRRPTTFFPTLRSFQTTANTMSQNMRAVLVKGGKSDSAKDLYLGEAERPTLQQGDGRIIVKVRLLARNRLRGRFDVDTTAIVRRSRHSA